MLSNKLTFSLVLVLMFTLVAGSAMAQVVSAPTLNADTDPGDGTTMVAKSFVVYERVSPNNGIDSDVVTVTATAAENFPNLYDVLRHGGTIALALSVGASDSTTNTIIAGAADDSPATPAADVSADHAATFAYKLLITEVMWGIDTSQTDADDTNSQARSQWIEIYNNGATLKSADIVALVFSANENDNPVGSIQPLTVAGTAGTYVIVDRLSTFNRFGALWELKGQSGNTARDSVTGDPPKDLVSMHRKIVVDPGDDPYKAKDDAKIGEIVVGLEGLGDGSEAGSWEASTGRSGITGGFVGSPGGVPASIVGITKAPGELKAIGIIINEVRNDTSEANLDWIELYHNNDADDAIPVNIKDYQLSVVTAPEKEGDAPKEMALASLPGYKLKPNEYLVVYNRHPGETKLAGGVNVMDVADGSQVNKGASHLYAVSSDLDIPNTGEQLIVLRTKATNADNPADGVIDVVGNAFYAVNKVVGKTNYNTAAYPLNGWSGLAAAGAKDNTFASSTQSWGRETVLDDNGNYRPKSTADAKRGEGWIAFDAKGGLGYDRDVDLATSPGTPGYANVAIDIISDDRDNEAKKVAYKFAGMISISEVMYDARHPRDLVQWIELYNNSPDTVINLQGWRMEIRNIADGKVESYVDSGFTFGGEDKDDVLILPNQTLLLVSRTGPSSVPRTRVYDLNQEHRTDLGLQRRDKVLLSSEGFYLELKAKINEGGAEKMMTVDSAGNLMVDGATRTKEWDLPPSDGEGPRTSIVRQYDAGAADPGDMEDSWKVSDLAGLAYYGHRDDAGTPGYRRGGPLPVSLSSFRPVRNQTTGHVDIKWITESELNNAGFNILRAESKTGEFTVINLQGIIAGHGTTSEKHVYTFTDKTAKPNVVYYYQIEDVSLNGNRTTLATTHMRGNVSAAGKVTTTWGDLKFQK